MTKKECKPKPFRDEDVQFIVEEGKHLIQDGWRPNDATQILEGIEVALDGSPKEDWERWTRMPLEIVIDDLFYLGTP